jgi:hypothetical protein
MKDFSIAFLDVGSFIFPGEVMFLYAGGSSFLTGQDQSQG